MFFVLLFMMSMNIGVPLSNIYYKKASVLKLPFRSQFKKIINKNSLRN